VRRDAPDAGIAQVLRRATYAVTVALPTLALARRLACVSASAGEVLAARPGGPGRRGTPRARRPRPAARSRARSRRSAPRARPSAAGSRSAARRRHARMCDVHDDGRPRVYSPGDDYANHWLGFALRTGRSRLLTAAHRRRGTGQPAPVPARSQLEAVPHLPHGDDAARRRRGRLQLAPQLGHVDVDGSAGHLRPVARHRAQELEPGGHRPPRSSSAASRSYSLGVSATAAPARRTTRVDRFTSTAPTRASSSDAPNGLIT